MSDAAVGYPTGVAGERPHRPAQFAEGVCRRPAFRRRFAGADVRVGRHRPLTEAVTHARVSFTTLAEQRSWLQSVMAFLVSIRPAWWLLRGCLAAWAVWGILLGSNHGLRPQGLMEFALALMSIVVSVQLGRGWLRHMAMTRPLLVLGNATAVVLALVASTSGMTSGELHFSAATDSSLQGVSLNRQQVGNIYPYDSEGKRITGVRLLAQDGHPLDGDLRIPLDANGNPIGLDANGNPIGIVRDSSGAQLRNVYPLAVAGADPWQVTDPAGSQMEPPAWTPPVSIVPLAPSAIPTPTPTPTSTPTPQLTRTATAAPTSQGTSKGVPPTPMAPSPSGQPTRR